MDIKLSDVSITPIIHSITRLNISDDEYFSKKYKDYISNSRLKLINPLQDGSPSLYKEGFSVSNSDSLLFGTFVHQCYLQPEEFELPVDYGKPSAKLGEVCDKAIKYRLSGNSIYSSIYKACIDVDYYSSNISTKRIKSILEVLIPYYSRLKKDNMLNKPTLCSKKIQSVHNCINNLKKCSAATKLISPVDLFGDPIECHNEDAIFIDYLCKYKDKSCTLKFKLKVDNWTIDTENKKLVLNDLKTTGKNVDYFMYKGGSFNKFHYSRQFAAYFEALYLLCKRDFNVDKSWNLEANVIAVETIGDNRVATYRVYPGQLSKGKEEFHKLLKMVGICELFGYNNNYKFI